MNIYFQQSSKSSSAPLTDSNALWEYIQTLSPDIVTQLSQPVPTVVQAMENHLVDLLGILPAQEFDVTISTSRERLEQMVASAIIYGYFLNKAHKKMSFETSWALSSSND